VQPVLCLPDMFKRFILQIDASADGIGAVLLQEVDGVKHPVAYASKKLLPREWNYSTIEREAFAIIWGIQKFQNYLMGTHFLLETDHHSLQYLDKAKFQNSRIMRWSLLIQPYRFTLLYCFGTCVHIMCLRMHMTITWLANLNYSQSWSLLSWNIFN